MKWIKVSERLPENLNAFSNDQCLITNGKTVYEGGYDYEHGWYVSRDDDDDVCMKKVLGHVTHWMPLPPPPIDKP